jgi:predicted site-specific integrase-resolvase
MALATHSSDAQFATISDAADREGIPRWKLREAVRRGLLPSYQFLNGRRLVRISEVLQLIENSRTGGAV